MFLGYMPINSAFRLLNLCKTAALVPTDSTTVPLYRVYGLSGLIANGSLAAANTGAVTNATNATPIVITSANHGLQTGQRVTISGVVGNTAANSTFSITRIDANTFSLDGSVGNGAYVSGGTWQVTGLYAASITPTAVSGYAQGAYYDIVVYATVGGNVTAQQYRFGVV